MAVILGIDGGNFRTKTVGPAGPDAFRSALAGWVRREDAENFGPDDMEYEIDGRRGLAGSVAAYEDEFGGAAMYGDTKAHEDAKTRVLLALARYAAKLQTGDTHFQIVVGQPIKTHTAEEKARIREMLVGSYRVAVNGEEPRRLFIDDVNVAREGASAYFAAAMPEDVRILDPGSGTVQAATIRGGRFINTGSDTFNFGTETVQDRRLASFAAGTLRNTTRLKWRTSDDLRVCGGSAEKLIAFIQERYPAAEVLRPRVRLDGGKLELLHPAFANAAAFYDLARRVYL